MATDTTDPGQQEEPKKLSLDVDIDKTSACERHITVTIARQDVDRYMADAFTEIQPRAEVPGFRPGRAPRKLVESRFKEQIAERVKGSLLMDSMTQVSEDYDFSAISEPDFDFEAITVPDDGPLTYEFDIEVRPEFDLPDWKGLQLEKPVREFSDDDVERHLKNILSDFAHPEPKEGAAEDQDYVTVNMVFKYDGEVVSEQYDETLRIRPTLSFHDGQLEGFDKLMIGAKKGDVKQGKVKVSEEADNEALRGKEVEAEFEVVEVKRLTLPEMTDEFLERIGVESPEQLRELVRNDLERQLAYRQQRVVRDQITGMLTESADWELPPDLLRRQSRRELERAVLELRSSGFSTEEIRAHENTLRQNSARSTAKALQEHFILERIAEENEIDATEQDFDQEVMMLAAREGDSPRRVRSRLEKSGQMDALRNQIVERKVIDLITENAQFTEKPFELPENKVEGVDFAVGGEPHEEADEHTDFARAQHAAQSKPEQERE